MSEIIKIKRVLRALELSEYPLSLLELSEKTVISKQGFRMFLKSMESLKLIENFQCYGRIYYYLPSQIGKKEKLLEVMVTQHNYSCKISREKYKGRDREKHRIRHFRDNYKNKSDEQIETKIEQLKENIKILTKLKENKDGKTSAGESSSGEN